MSTPRRKLAVVAREAGVSVSTVSKVLRAYPDVAPATRERVRAVLRSAGYPVETAVRRHPSVLVDVVVGSTERTWAGEVLAGLAERVREPGLAVVVTTVMPGCPVPRLWLEQLFARGSRGVIGLDAEFTEVQRAYLAAHQIPCVLVDSGLDDAVSHALAAILEMPAELAG
ncbi:LacI family DNA-binding transcriptional regulator [Kribbella sp. CA-245084]|uniref:LacI family DNA-binding transcriptional regulator n=1 Tax=Kribbella sp. CA-245084 TaxID=3239940 RepID=UPI003D8FCAA8